MSTNKQPGNNKSSQPDDLALGAETEQKKPSGTTRKTGGHAQSK